MGAKTKIEWSESTWTPIRARNLKTGRVGWYCVHKSTGCENCYAEGMNLRLGTGLPFKPGHRADVELFLDEKTLVQPLRWKRPRMIFVCSMTDAFADFVEDGWLDRMFAVMALCPQHVFQCLTKRAERMRKYMCDTNTPHRIAQEIDIIEGSAPSSPENILPILEYPGYFASSHGFIYSEKRGRRRKLKPDVGEDGHMRVQLYTSGDKSYDRVLVHRIILEVFVGPPPSSLAQGRHRDRNPSNNALANLRWGDQEANWDDSKRHGTHRRHSKLTPEQVEHIRLLLDTKESLVKIAREFDVSETQIRNIRDGKQWAVESPIQWPLGNCWMGVSAERQEEADERIPLLLQTPAAVRFVSLEPLLGPIDLGRIVRKALFDGIIYPDGKARPLGWTIVGGESGPKARPMKTNWAEAIVSQCKAAGVACFVKQLGAKPYVELPPTGYMAQDQVRRHDFRFKSAKGGDPREWPPHLRVREMPKCATS